MNDQQIDDLFIGLSEPDQDLLTARAIGEGLSPHAILRMHGVPSAWSASKRARYEPEARERRRQIDEENRRG